MDALFTRLLSYFRLHQPPTPVTTHDEPAQKYISITKYNDLHHPRDIGYISTYKYKNYHYHFDQSIKRNYD